MKRRLKKKVVQAASNLIPVKPWRRDFRNYFLGHPVYGKIYPPLYNMRVPIVQGYPEIYNREGRRMEMFFLRDRVMAHSPYCLDVAPTQFLWDRFNIGLDTHFYSHEHMLETMGDPSRRYGMLVESEAILPNDYKLFEKHKGLEKEFTAIFTYSEEILDKVDNAKFVPFAATPWYALPQEGGVLNPLQCEKKTKNISIVSSRKASCDLHRYRLELARKCKREALADTFGTFDGGPRIRLADCLADYRYSIVVENDIKPYYFSERLTSCFQAMTIPIYLGATKIDKFFNTDGIIKIDTSSDMEKVLSQCNEKDYLGRLDAIKDNYRRVRQYENIWDWMYGKYLSPEGK